MALLSEHEFEHIPCVSLLMRILSIDKINELYDRNKGYVGPDFAQAVLDELGISYKILNREALRLLPEGPFITVSNHPYGHIDGLILVDLFGHVRNDFKVMVNGILGRIVPMEKNFICVTPVGNEAVPASDNLNGVRKAILHVREGHPLGLFPSGAVSDLSLKDGCVRDREWQESVIRLISKLDVPVLPVAFLDGNSPFYYSLGLIDWRVRLLRLPSEVFNKKGKVQRIALGNLISPHDLGEHKDVAEFSKYLRQKVDDLKLQRL